MKKNLLSLTCWSFIILTLFFASSCKTSKKAKDDIAKASAIEDILTKISDTSFRPDWFRAKAQLQAKVDGKGLSFTSTIISKNEEILWMNGKKFSIEGGRIMITPDSIFAINRFQKQYLAEKSDWVSEEFELPALLTQALDLNHIQDIFIGNPILDIIPYTEIIPKESEVLLTGTKDDYHTELMVNSASMQARYFTLSQGESILTIKYSDYRIIDGNPSFAHRRDIVVQRPNEKEIQLSILYDNVIINKAQEIKFNIPSNYNPMSF